MDKNNKKFINFLKKIINGNIQIQSKDEENKLFKNQLFNINLEKDRLIKELNNKEIEIKNKEKELNNKEIEIKNKEKELKEIKNKLLLSNNRVENLKLLLEGQKINFESENLLLIEQLNISQNQTHKIYKEYLENKVYINETRKQIDKAKMLFARLLKNIG